MRPPLFFAIFIPLLTTIVVTLFLIFSSNKRLDSRGSKMAITVVIIGLLGFCGLMGLRFL